MKYFAILVFVVISFVSAYAIELPRDLMMGEDYSYVIRMNNGDVMTGSIVEFKNSPENGEGFRFKMEIGTATIYANQIKEIKLYEDSYRHDSRVFLLPTAKAIKNNHYFGSFELLFFNAGIGITDYVSVMVGRSVLPFINGTDQITNLDTKVTFYDRQFEDYDGGLALAVGGNLAFINDNNRLIHGYAVATFTGAKSRLTGNVYYKAGSADYYDVRFRDQLLDLQYADGAFGVGLGVDTRIDSWKGIHVIGELWNNNVEKPTNTAVLLGVRLCNDEFAADFGFAFSTAPFAAPFASFVWTMF